MVFALLPGEMPQTDMRRPIGAPELTHLGAKRHKV
jgi:hypothetical protein